MIRFTDTYVEYSSGTRALRGVSMEINDGEFVFIVGPSGAGKSTLTKLLTAELRPSSGTAVVNGFSIGNMKRREIPALRRTIGVVYQDFKLIDRMTVFDNVAYAMHVVGEHDKNKIRERVMNVLSLVGLEEKYMRRPGELSGGEQQRAVIARALVNNPGMIIADEPTGNLDPARSYEIMELLVKINRLGSTVVVITHERELVDSFEKRVILIEDGHVAGDREHGYVGSMVSDGSELSVSEGFAPAESEEPIAAKEASLQPENAVCEEPSSSEEPELSVSGSDAEGGISGETEEAHNTAAEDAEASSENESTEDEPEDGTRFFAVSSEEPEFLRVFMDTDETQEQSEADEGMLMAILGDDSEEADENTDKERDGTE
ncbi:MAG: ATP-binding cassette domain-containing protein [Clostridia bacterium]|nr:ATP-binding cassette domain-containing protein [Clostridia bacterium]